MDYKVWNLFFFFFSCESNMNRMMVMTIYRARIMTTIYRSPIYPCCNSMLIVLERPQSSSLLFLSLMVRAGYVCVCHDPPNSDIENRIFIVRTDVNACDCTQGCTDTERESALKADPGKKISCRTGESNLRQRRDETTL